MGKLPPPAQKMSLSKLGCDIGGAKELGVMYFPTNWGAKEPQNLPNHRVARSGPVCSMCFSAGV